MKFTPKVIIAINRFVVQSVKKQQQQQQQQNHTPINFNTNCRREMNLVPINMDYCLHRFDTLKLSLGVSLHWGISS